ncbi:MAG TPA: flagellar basal body-associated FliL family protein [Armatimonadota bacterium]|jgi:flagellar basal body-associated protein FliL
MSRSGKLDKKVLIGLVLLLVGAGVGVGVGMRSRAAVAPAPANALAGGEAAAAAPADKPPAPLLSVVDLGEFLVNVTAKTGLRYCRAQVAVEVGGLGEGEPGKKEEKKEGKAADKLPELPPEDLLRAKDITVKQLTSSDFETLQTTTGRDEVRQRISVALNKALPRYKIGEVLLVSFVMQ